MNRIRLLVLTFATAALTGGAMVAGCGGDDSGGSPQGDAGGDVSRSDAGSGEDANAGNDTGSGNDGGGDAGGDSSNGTTYSIGGTVTGLSGSGLVLKNNAGDPLPIEADGSFVFSGRLAANATFSVTVGTQPSNPTQNCTVSGGSGTVGMSDVTSITVNCSSSQYTVGGTVSGLNGTLVLQNNASDTVALTSNGTFAFPTTLANAAPYAVTVLTQPAGQQCTVTNGTGTVSGANVTTVTVNCVAKQYTVGGTLSGLPATTSIQLQNNGKDPITLDKDGIFTFPATLASGTSYNVTIATQPAGTTCTVNGATGRVGSGNVTSVAVNCAAGKYTIGGTISGLDGNVTLQNNSGDNLTLTANGTFAFATPLATGANYAVTVLTNPTGQTCTVNNATGTVGTANVTNVAVTCVYDKHTVGGTITGLKGNIVLQDNGGDNLQRNADGSFTFATAIAYKSSYNVTVKTQPAGQTCRVANGSGIMGTSNVTDVLVTCEDKHTIGGTITNLGTSPVVLQNNNGDNLTVNPPDSGAVTQFKFATALPQGATYSVTILTQPADRNCSVQSGTATGTVGAVDVNSVTLTCTPR